MDSSSKPSDPVADRTVRRASQSRNPGAAVVRENR